MRKVLFKKWIPLRRVKLEGNSYESPEPGTHCWDPEFIHEGLFHGWGFNYEEFDSGPGNFSIALIENPDGTISEVLPQNIKFIS